MPKPRYANHPTLRMSSRLRAAATLLCCALVAACGTPAVQSPSLYDRLGGAAGVAKFVHATLARSSTEPRTARSFDGVKLQPLQQSLAEHICMLSGGGCRYQGANMADAHKDSHIRDSEFDAIVSILREELDRAGVSISAKNELLRLLASMKRDIVAKPGGAAATTLAALP